jgi:ribonuclease P protein component
MRFRAEQRLRRQRDFRAAREQGRRIDCGGFTLWFVRREEESAPRDSNGPLAPSSEATPGDSGQPSVPLAAAAFDRPRVGVVASTAAVGNAVCRNRAKRRLRAIFRNHQDLVPNNVDLLLVARNSLNRLEYAELERRFVDTCRRLFALKP